MILPIKTELQMSVIGGTQSKMVSPLILSFLDADMKYAQSKMVSSLVLQFQGVCVLVGKSLFRDRVTGFTGYRRG
jgi:hypothetical protein